VINAIEISRDYPLKEITFVLLGFSGIHAKDEYRD
jgi:hypothetical protein